MSAKDVLAYGLSIILILFSVNLIIGYQVWDENPEMREIPSMSLDGIYGSISVGQTFVSRYNGLSRIDILLATHARNNTEEVMFHLRDARARYIAKISINATTVTNNSYYAFSFPQIHDSKNRIFYFFLESPNSTRANAITSLFTPYDSYPDGEIVSVNIEPKPSGDLIFRTYYHWMSFSYVLSDFAERILGNLVFFFPLCFLISALIFFAVKLHFNGRKIFVRRYRNVVVSS